MADISPKYRRHRYHPYEIIEIREAPQAEVDNAVKVLEAWRDQMLAKSREDEHFPYSADEFIKLGSIATYSILKDQSGKMSKILKQLKDQSLINKEYRDSIDQLTTRVGNLELFSYKVALMTMLEVYFMEKMFTEDSDIPEDFTLNNGLNSASEGSILANTGIPKNIWQQMRSVLLKSPSGRNATVHDRYPDKDILLNAYNCLIQNDKPDQDVALAFMKIIAR